MILYLQSINRWLRYTGFRLRVHLCEPASAGPIGFSLAWYGWRNFGSWDPRPWELVDCGFGDGKAWALREPPSPGEVVH